METKHILSGKNMSHFCTFQFSAGCLCSLAQAPVEKLQTHNVFEPAVSSSRAVSLDFKPYENLQFVSLWSFLSPTIEPQRLLCLIWSDDPCGLHLFTGSVQFSSPNKDSISIYHTLCMEQWCTCLWEVWKYFWKSQTNQINQNNQATNRF